MTEQELRKSYVSVMNSWVGVKEGSSGHKKIVDIYNSLQPLPRGYKLKYTDAWCAATVSAAAAVAGLLQIIPVECSCALLVQKFQQMGRWQEKDDYVPSPGDLMFYDWDDDGKGDNKGAPDHVGVVEFVQNGIIVVIEGNKGGHPDNVAKRSVVVNGKTIRGFGCPDFKSLETKLTEGETTMNAVKGDGVITDTAYWRDCIDGKRTASGANIKALIEKYHAKLVDATASTGKKTLLLANGDDVIKSEQYWIDVVDGKIVPSAANVKSLILKYHDALSIMM